MKVQKIKQIAKKAGFVLGFFLMVSSYQNCGYKTAFVTKVPVLTVLLASSHNGSQAPVLSKTFIVKEKMSLQPHVIASTSAQFQWFKNGLALDGATHKVLSIETVSEKDAGTYALQILDGEELIKTPDYNVQILETLKNSVSEFKIVQPSSIEGWLLIAALSKDSTGSLLRKTE